MNFIVILIFLLTYSNSTIKFTGDGDIKLSQLDAFLEAFVDEVFIFFKNIFIRSEPLLSQNFYLTNFRAIKTIYVNNYFLIL